MTTVRHRKTQSVVINHFNTTISAVRLVSLRDNNNKEN
jgi:hypothetical protein